MLEKIDKKLEAIYYKNKDKKNPSVPVKTIREYLILEGILLDDD